VVTGCAAGVPIRCRPWYALVLTAAELRELIGKLDELVGPYRSLVRVEVAAGARRVHLDWHAFPVAE
jgi:hypothetical protein